MLQYTTRWEISVQLNSYSPSGDARGPVRWMLSVSGMTKPGVIGDFHDLDSAMLCAADLRNRIDEARSLPAAQRIVAGELTEAAA